MQPCGGRIQSEGPTTHPEGGRPWLEVQARAPLAVMIQVLAEVGTGCPGSLICQQAGVELTTLELAPCWRPARLLPVAGGEARFGGQGLGVPP
jgi:hypothetical protein